MFSPGGGTFDGNRECVQEHGDFWWMKEVMPQHRSDRAQGGGVKVR